jgi:hypothetical protein
MAEQQQHAEVKTENKTHSVPEVASWSPVAASLPYLLFRAACDATLQSQADCLGDVRFQKAQRQGLAVQIEKAQGNNHLQRVLALAKSSSVQGVDLTPAYSPIIQAEPGGPSASVRKVEINMTAQAPSVSRPMASQIQSSHNRPDVVGWCAPFWDFPDSGITIVAPTAANPDDPYGVKIAWTLGFEIELAQEYTGAQLAALSDHENGHVTIGKRLAAKHFGSGLKSRLETYNLPNGKITTDEVLSQVALSAQDFKKKEEDESAKYDGRDYPRLDLAYRGIRDPLAKLSADFGSIGFMASSLRNFESGAAIETGQQERVAELARDAIQARQGLGKDEISMLQYNAEFKGLVSTCQGSANGLLNKFSEKEESAETANALREMIQMLGVFTWAGPG